MLYNRVYRSNRPSNECYDESRAASVRRQRSITRRAALKYGTVAGVGAAVGSAALAGSAAAADPSDYRVCWIDVKPDSCPNSINPRQNGVVSVAAGWPRFDDSTVRLIPVSGSYDGRFGDCQNYRNPAYDTDTETINEIRGLLQASADGREARPIRSTVEDRSGSGDDDTTFHFRASDLELRPSDTHLVLVGDSTTNDFTYVGIDTVRVLDTPASSNGRGSR